jgi:hypothetical protein
MLYVYFSYGSELSASNAFDVVTQDVLYVAPGLFLGIVR